MSVGRGPSHIGANALLSCIFDGLFCGAGVVNYVRDAELLAADLDARVYDAEVKREQAKMDALIAARGDENPYVIGHEMGEEMTAASTVVKTGPRMLQAMDKVTARISKIEAPVGQAVRYGDLEIHVKSCRKRPPEEPPESAAFLEIFETKKGERRKVFGGWMFASSPALSAMDHPVYDVWVVDCKIERAGAPKGATKAPKKR